MRSASLIQRAAASLSLFGNCSKSATERKATSSVSSSLALGSSEATVSATEFDGMGTLLVGATFNFRDCLFACDRAVRGLLRMRAARTLSILPQRPAPAATVGCVGQVRQAA
ncbi:hypothetical protein GCM10018782_45920 [Streptomyces griseoaurantiacus]|nr:hypothetical protein GCM10018782_45920 [Streptomyces griseoaurantiacus]